MKFSPYVIGLTTVLVSTVLLSTAGVMTRLVAMDSATILFWRGVWGGAVLLAALLLLAPRQARRDFFRLGPPGWAICLLTTASMIFFITALHRTSVAHVAIIFATAPFVSAAFGFFLLSERPGRGAIVASLAALAGVALMVGTGGTGGLFGDFLAVLMTICMALTNILMRRFPDTPVLMSAGISAVLGSLVTLPFATPLAAATGDIAIVALFGIFGFAFGLGLLLYGARLLPPVETALIGALDAPLAPLWVWLLFNERLDAVTMIGGAVVVAAVCLHVLADIRRRSTETAAA
ncbi:hypothetical protein DEM27_05395 [Metarhizobium album]|uniref:EamA domain-containing protein n=1 Tax=Metarhizobium album TaxID=2182425 RepID=A0A2U2DUT9_9HYPH|nr:DMT family transporter [Rhizobium album]PWE57078.1 hypothetical protein DEM27_05395 [Rhizobium album]